MGRALQGDTNALGATGRNFILVKANGARTVSKLTANVAGPALNIEGQLSQKVTSLKADQLDGKSG